MAAPASASAPDVLDTLLDEICRQDKEQFESLRMLVATLYRAERTLRPEDVQLFVDAIEAKHAATRLREATADSFATMVVARFSSVVTKIPREVLVAYGASKAH